VIDNLGAHRPKRIRELIEGRGCDLIYLPVYSADLNPIEQALSKVKHILSKIAARTKEAFIEAMGRALTAVSAQDVRGFFVHCGYHVDFSGQDVQVHAIHRQNARKLLRDVPEPYDRSSRLGWLRLR
jgi:DDE superfamily endonuclease